MKSKWIVFGVALCLIAFVGSVRAEDVYKPGLAAHYYKDATNWGGLWPDDTDKPLADPKTCTFTKYDHSQVEPVVNHLFIRSGWFSVRWVGYVDVPGDAVNVFTFEVWADDGCRLQVDDQVLVNSWYACPEDIPDAHRTATANLTPGKHRLIVEYFQGQSLEANDSDPIKLYWSCPALKLDKEVIPDAKLSHKTEDEGTPDNWAVKPPLTNQQLAEGCWTDAQNAEAAKDYSYALRLYRRVLLLVPNTELATKAKARILAIESDPTITNK